MRLVAHVLDLMLDHVLDHMIDHVLDHMLDHIIIDLVTKALQLHGCGSHPIITT